MKKPYFCPNKACTFYHKENLTSSKWYRKRGFYHSQGRGSIQRFQCTGCGTTFSAQTFSIDFRTRKSISYHRILTHLVTSSGIRDIARDMKVAPSTILNRISRLARQCIAVHASLCSQIHLSEALTADGFESFAVSQYFPNNIHLLAGKDSQFWYASDLAHLRRKGNMTEGQKKKNKKLQNAFISGRVTIYSSFLRILSCIRRLYLQNPDTPMVLITDKHTHYIRALQSFRLFTAGILKHIAISSLVRRTVENLLFAVNYLDREIRKDCAEHCRETVKYARNVCNSLERLAIYRMYHNYMKPFRITGKEYRGKSHAMVAGLEKSVIAGELKTVYTRRRFLYQVDGLDMSEALVWLRGVATPLKRYAEILPGFAWD